VEQVIIDGKEYVPKGTVISKECLQALSALYSRVWPEAYYDARNESTEKFARDLCPYLELLNEELRFRR
jgi:hypothetical protein